MLIIIRTLNIIHMRPALVYDLCFMSSASWTLLLSVDPLSPAMLTCGLSVSFTLALHFFLPFLLKRENVRSQAWWLVFVNPAEGGGEDSGKREGLLLVSKSLFLCEPQVSLGHPVSKGKVDELGGRTCRFVPGLYRYTCTQCTYTLTGCTHTLPNI